LIIRELEGLRENVLDGVEGRFLEEGLKMVRLEKD
jgi:hypothetical protein